MAATSQGLDLLHPSLDDTRPGSPIETAPLGDRQRLGVLLEGCALVAHLARIGRHPLPGWPGARVSSRGRLVGVAIESAPPRHADRSRDRPGATASSSCRHGAVDLTTQLAQRLFGDAEVSGRGGARRVARALLRRWTLYLFPVRADAMVEDVLDAAPFLWSDRFATYRESLIGVVRDGGIERASVAGPPSFRRRAEGIDARSLIERVRGPQGLAWWGGAAAPGSDAGPRRGLEVREPRSGPWAVASPRVSAATTTDPPAAEPLETLATECRHGRWRAALREAARLRSSGVPAPLRCDVARLAVEASLHLWSASAAAEWATFAAAGADGEDAADARRLSELVRAEWDDGDAGSARSTAATLLLAPRACRSLEPAKAALEIGTLLRARREGVGRARLWLALGAAREAAGAPRAAERAFLHALRHALRNEAPVDRWRAAAALVAVRLGRGAFEGLDAAIATLRAEARLGGDRRRALQAALIAWRLDLARGDAERVASESRSFLDRLPASCPARAAREVESVRAEAERRCAVAAPTAAAVERSAGSRAVADGSGSAAGAIVGACRALRAALGRIDRLARSDVPVLLLGETGTGKELAARRLHDGSSRRRRPFLAVNCAALSESLLLSELFGHARGAFTGADRDHAGVFETADGGVVFLDEIGDLPVAAQGALLRVLQEGEVRRVGESRARRVDVRVVAATHRDLPGLVARGAFRQDLYYRLNVGAVRLPPLRDRDRDVLLLARHFLAAQVPALRLAPDAEDRLLACAWPGNVRELRSVLQLAVALHEGGGILRARDLELPPAAASRSATYHAAMDAERRRLLEEALAATDGRRSDAARRLGITPQAVSYLVRRLGLEGASGSAVAKGPGGEGGAPSAAASATRALRRDRRRRHGRRHRLSPGT